MNILLNSPLIEELEILAKEKNTSKEEIVKKIISNGLNCARRIDKESLILIIKPKNNKDKIILIPNN
jgi:hypothetical protein